MQTKAKYHLYETAHSGLIEDATVNLVPKTWTKRTVTDGEWMYKNTIKALDWRDYYLANVIDAVDEDKYEHYKAGYCIEIDKQTNTIYYNPVDKNYRFKADSGMFIDEQTNYVYTKIPDSVNGITNRIIMNEDKLDYELSATRSECTGTLNDEKEINDSARGIVDPESISSFPQGCNIVFVESAYLDINDTFSSWVVKTGYDDYYDRTISSRVEHTYFNTLVDSADMLETSSFENVFNPNDTTPYAGEFEGGSNFISGDVNMVPTGVLFVW